MTEEKWEKIIYQIEEKFGISARSKEEIDVAEDREGKKIKGQKETIEFAGLNGKMKLERISRPRIIDKKVLSSKRIGGKVAVDFVYSPDEMVSQLKLCRWSNELNDWQEVPKISEQSEDRFS